VRDLETTVNAVDCDLVLVGTPIDLSWVIRIDKPYQRVGYKLAEEGASLVKAVQGIFA